MKSVYYSFEIGERRSTAPGMCNIPQVNIPNDWIYSFMLKVLQLINGVNWAFFGGIDLE